MTPLTYILILQFLNYTFAKTCVIDNTPEYITWEAELIEDLNCNYNANKPPSDNTTVNIIYYLKGFYFNDKEGQISMQTWMNCKWKDERLKWDPEKHHGINETDALKLSIWTPYFGIANSYELNEYAIFYLYDLKSNGDVHYKHLLYQDASCNVKLTNWPYDLQECNFIFEPEEAYRPWLRYNYTINFDFIVMEPNSPGWYIYDYNHVKNNHTNGQVKLTFFLMREAVGLSAIFIWPTFVLTVLSVLSLYLDVRRKVRLAIICLSLLGHYYFLTELSYNIPTESQFSPTLLLYYRGSVILSVIIVISTLFLAAMCELKSTPYYFVKLINDFVYENNYRTYLVFPRWDFEDATVDSKPSSEDWVKFANIVNSVFIFCIVFAYIGLYGTMMPKQK